MIDLKNEYLSNLKRAAEKIRNNDDIRVYSHYDADGVSSAIIISEILRRQGKKFHLSFLKSFDINAIKEDEDKITILSDLGSDGIAEINDERVILVDHHSIPPIEDKKIIDLNPRTFGYDGSREACSSSVAYLLAISVDDSNNDLFPYYISGAIGDKQDVGGYYGINFRLNEEFGKKYPIKQDINIDGRSVTDAIYYSTDPYFIGLTGHRDSVREFLKEMKIDPDSSLEKLSEEQRTKLADKLMLILIKENTSKEGYENLVSKRFFFNSLGVSGKELSSYLDYAGRSGNMGLAVAWEMGDEEAFDKIEKTALSFKDELINEVTRAAETVKEMNHIQVLNVMNESLTGTVSGIVMLYILKKNKPTVGIYKNKGIKISTRATRDLVSKGVDLSTAVATAASEVGGHGGGHNIAAGGEIPLESENLFLMKLDSIVGEQVGNSKNAS